MSHDLNAVFYSRTYHPIQAGSIDGTDTTSHDNAVYRAMLATSTGLYDPLGDPKASGNPHCVVFVGRLSKETTESTLQEVMSRYGRVKNIRLVRHIVTGASQGYAFVEYETEKEMQYAYEGAHLIKIDGSQVLVDYNRQLMMPGWIPRRLGGGLGGRKESGQLRFGGRDRPFRKPLRPIPEKELEFLGISLPGGYLQRYETPPLPRKRSSQFTSRTKDDDMLPEVGSSDHKRRHHVRLDERHEHRGSSDPRSRSSQHHHDYSKRDYEEEDSGRRRQHHGRDRNRERHRDEEKRSQHHGRERNRERHREEEDKRQHHHARREDAHSSRGHGSSKHVGKHGRSHSSDSDARDTARKMHRGRDNARSASREPQADDRWEP